MDSIADRIAARRAELAAASTPTASIADRIAARRAELDDPRAAAIAAAKAGTLQASPESLARAADADQIAQDEITLSGRPHIGNLSASAVRGIPFAGEYVDEAFNAIDPGRGDVLREVQGAMERQRPGQDIAAQIAGGVAGSLPMVAAAAPAVVARAPVSMTGRVLAGGGAGAVAGGTEGAVSGYGRGETPDERANEATRGAVLGGGLGGTLGAAAPAVAKGASNLYQWAKNSDIGTIAREWGVSKDAASVIKSALEADDLNRASRQLRNVGEEAMLADAGPATQQLLDTSMSEGGAALATGRRALENRAQTTTPALTRAFDAILGTPQGIKTSARKIAGSSARAREKAYSAAYSQPTPTVGPKADAINDVLDRIDDDTLRAAVKEANAAMKESGAKNQNIILDLDTGAITQPMNIQQLDELKKALNETARKSVDQKTGLLDGAGLRANRLASDLRDAIVDAVPVYGRAVKLGGDNAAEKSALMLGRSVLTRNVKLEDVQAAMKGASRAEKTAFKQGLREAIEDQMSNAKRVISDPDGMAREAKAAWDALSSRASREKIEAAIGPAASKRITALMKRELPMLTTRSTAARGSQTAIRGAGQKALTEQMAPGVVGSAARGEPVNATKRILQVLNNVTPQADAKARAKVLDEIVTALTAKRGKEARAALVVARKAMKGQPVTDAQAALIGRALGTGFSLGGYQTMKPLQATR